MDWDSIIETKTKTKDFIGGDDLTAFKTFVANLPDQLPDSQTARVYIEVVVNK